MTEYMGDNILESIGRMIPGYEGYARRKSRRETDQALRRNLAQSLDDCQKALDDVGRKAVEDGSLEVAGKIDKMKGALGRLANNLRYAEYGASGFFDRVQVKERDLDRIHKYDLRLKKETEKLETDIRAIGETQDLDEALEGLRERIAELIEKVDQRMNIIKGAE